MTDSIVENSIKNHDEDEEDNDSDIIEDIHLENASIVDDENKSNSTNNSILNQVNLLAEEFNQGKVSLIFSSEITEILRLRGINVANLGLLRSLIKNHRLKALILGEAVVLIAHAQLFEKLAAAKANRDELFVVVDYLNLLMGLDDFSESYWRDTLYIKLLETFPSLLDEDETNNPRLLQNRVLLFQLVHSLVERTGVEIFSACKQMLAKCSPLGHDAGSKSARKSSKLNVDSKQNENNTDQSLEKFQIVGATQLTDSATEIPWKISVDDVCRKSVKRMMRVVEGNDVKDNTNWVQMILMVMDEITEDGSSLEPSQKLNDSIALNTEIKKEEHRPGRKKVRKKRVMAVSSPSTSVSSGERRRQRALEALNDDYREEKPIKESKKPIVSQHAGRSLVASLPPRVLERPSETVSNDKNIDDDDDEWVVMGETKSEREEEDVDDDDDNDETNENNSSNQNNNNNSNNNNLRSSLATRLKLNFLHAKSSFKNRR